MSEIEKVRIFKKLHFVWTGVFLMNLIFLGVIGTYFCVKGYHDYKVSVTSLGIIHIVGSFLLLHGCRKMWADYLLYRKYEKHLLEEQK